MAVIKVALSVSFFFFFFFFKKGTNIKGKNIDHMKVLEKLKKKYSRNVELISFFPNPKSEDKGKKVPEKKDDKVYIYNHFNSV